MTTIKFRCRKHEWQEVKEIKYAEFKRTSLEKVTKNKYINNEYGTGLILECGCKYVTPQILFEMIME